MKPKQKHIKVLAFPRKGGNLELKTYFRKEYWGRITWFKFSNTFLERKYK